jgi:hypothetical protein
MSWKNKRRMLIVAQHKLWFQGRGMEGSSARGFCCGYGCEKDAHVLEGRHQLHTDTSVGSMLP